MNNLQITYDPTTGFVVDDNSARIQREKLLAESLNETAKKQ